MDGEFVPMKRKLASAGVILNTTSANERVPKTERQLCVIKERVRAKRHALPFKVIPLTDVLIKLICSSVLWINAFPPEGGVSSALSPRDMMTGIQFDHKNEHCKLQFGSCVQAHQEPDPTNAQAARAVGAICLGPTGNVQGSHKFLNLRTGKRITRRSWTELPMPQEAIEQVNQLGAADRQPELLTFCDRKGRLIGETENPGVPDNVDTAVPDEQDGIEDLNPPTVNTDCGLGEPRDECPPIVETPETDDDPVEQPEIPEDDF